MIIKAINTKCNKLPWSRNVQKHPYFRKKEKRHSVSHTQRSYYGNKFCALHVHVHICHGMLWNSPYLRLTLLHQALVTESRWTWQPSPTSLGIRGLRSRRPQHRIECWKRCCRLHDVKRVTASCRNDIMISYKSSHLVGKMTTFQLFIG